MALTDHEEAQFLFSVPDIFDSRVICVGQQYLIFYNRFFAHCILSIAAFMNILDVATLTRVLQSSMSPNPAEIKQAESQLTQAEDQSAGSLLITLLSTVFNLSENIPVRQAAAIFSKNLLKRRWLKSEDDAIQHKPLDSNYKDQVRNVLVESTCGPSAVPQVRQVQAQINAIISFIAEVDFPSGWPSLLPSLVATLRSSPSDELRLNALTCSCSVFKKYKSVSRSATILRELQYLLPLFQEVHLDLFKSVLPAIVGNPSGTSKEVFAAMEQILDIFYSLNVVDIPEFYQDNINIWIAGFLELLALPTQKSPNTDEPGPLESLKALACENLSLYADKYQDPFEPFVASSVKAVWSLLVSLDLNEGRFDLVVAAGIRFLSSAANTRWTQSPFEEHEALVQICEKLVLPNIQLRDADVELFSDNADDYMRKDLQNADAETRRRSAVDLVKALSKFYEGQVTDILLRYVQTLLTGAAQSNPRAKDACIQLVSAVAVKGETRAQGVTQVNAKVDINQFFASHILPDLRQGTGNSEERGVLVASALKFVILFRNRLEVGLVAQAVPSISSMITVKSPKVVQSYAAHALFLISSVPNVTLPAEAYGGIENALTIIASTGEQNEYLIKLVSRLLMIGSLPQAGKEAVLGKLLILISTFSINPVNAVFTHFLFESLGSVVSGSSLPVREKLIPPLCQLLEKNVMEYIPYALQILALLIESSPTGSEIFNQLLTLLMNEELWRNPSLVPGIARIVSAYLHRADLYGPRMDLTTLVGRIQLLLGTSKFEGVGFELTNTLFTSNLGSAVGENVLHPLLLSALTKIHTKRTDKLVRMFGLSLACLVAHMGGDSLVAVLEKIQVGLSLQVIKDLWMTSVSGLNANTLSRKSKKAYLVALSKLLTMNSVQTNPVLLHAILAASEAMLVANPGKVSVGEPGVEFERKDEVGGDHEFEVTYAKLVSTANAVLDADFLPQIEGDGVAQFRAVVKGLPMGALQSNQSLAQWAAM
jgi:exportin-2 (importin alpha re-exporter)